MQTVEELLRVSFLSSKEANDEFSQVLKKRAEALLATPKVKHNAHIRLYLKGLVFLTIWVSSYMLLVFWAANAWQLLATGAVFAFACAGMGFNVMHDGSHEAFFPVKYKRFNAAAASVMDILGASALLWLIKHVLGHHTLPNFDERDADISQPPFLRLALTQKWYWFHKYQHIYAWALYGLLPLKIQLFGFLTFRKDYLGQIRIKKLGVKGWMLFWLWKAVFWSWALVLPLILHWDAKFTVLLVFFCVSWLFGTIMSVVFQMAHVVDEAGFYSLDDVDSQGKLSTTFMRYQLLTTQDFATGESVWNKCVTWYLGGLNRQTIHHLFSKQPHTLYPELQKIVEQTCDEYEVRYIQWPTVRGALGSHARHLKDMGRRPYAVPADASTS